MNCDEAFDALTDVEQCHSDQLQQHLKTCSRCRQMSEVLSPALALFDSSGNHSQREPDEPCDDTTSEPLREQFLSVNAVLLARETAQRLAVPAEHPPASVPGRNMNWLLLQVAVAAATSAAVAIAFALFFPPSSASPARRPVSSATAQICLLKNKPVLEKMRGNSNSVVSSCVACHFEKSTGTF